jgi:hypothetical protein
MFQKVFWGRGMTGTRAPLKIESIDQTTTPRSLMARALRAKSSMLRLAIRFLAGANVLGHQAAAADRRPHE